MLRVIVSSCINLAYAYLGEYTGLVKKVTQPNTVHNFVKYWPIFIIFFHHYILQEIDNKPIIKYPTSPQTRLYTSLPCEMLSENLLAHPVESREQSTDLIMGLAY